MGYFGVFEKSFIGGQPSCLLQGQCVFPVVCEYQPAATQEVPCPDSDLSVSVRHITHHIDRFFFKLFYMPVVFHRQPHLFFRKFRDFPDGAFDVLPVASRGQEIIHKEHGMRHRLDPLTPPDRCLFHSVPVSETQHILHRPLADQGTNHEALVTFNPVRTQQCFPQPEQVLIGAIFPEQRHEDFRPRRRETLPDIVLGMVLAPGSIPEIMRFCVPLCPVIFHYPVLDT